MVMVFLVETSLIQCFILMNLDWRLDLDRMKPVKEVFPGCTKN